MQNNNNPDGRKKYARSLMLVKIGDYPIMFDATGTDNKTLSADSTDDITEKDCSDFAKGKVSQTLQKSDLINLPVEI